MPKSSLRCNHRSMRRDSCSSTCAVPVPIRVQPSLAGGSFLLSAPPRKVSFEDNRSDSNRSISICSGSDDTVPTKNNKKTQITEGREREGERRSPPLRRKRSLLARPITSLSLVDLAKSVPQDVSSMINEQDLSDEDHIVERKSKRIRSFSLSPRSIVSTPKLSDVDHQHLHLHQHLHSPQTSTEGESKSARTSPWGHFIDMVPDEDDNDYGNFQIPAYPNYDAILKPYRRIPPHSSCRTRRRPSPYAEYKSYRTKEAKPALTFIRLRTDSRLTPVISTQTKQKGNFRLTPICKNGQQEPTDQLIGVFSELQVGQQKTSI